MGEAIRSLPQGLLPVGRTSIFLEQRSVRLPCRGEVTRELVEEAQARFYEQTRWHLEVVIQSPTPGVPAAPCKKTSGPQVFPSPSSCIGSPHPSRPLPEQEALEHARRVLGSLPGYLKVGVDQAKRALRVRFLFPDAAQARYGESLAQVQAQTGWQIQLSARPQQEALIELAQRLLPQDVTCMKGPSVYWDKRIVSLECLGPISQEARAEVERQFAEETGWSLELQIPSSQGDAPAHCSQAEAMAHLGVVLLGAQDLYQIGADTNRGVLWLHFHFPDVAKVRYADQLSRLVAQTGWRVELHPRVHQQALIEQARALLPAGVSIVGKTSVFQDQQLLSLTCTGSMSEEEQQEIQQRFLEQTGWQLSIVRAAGEGSGNSNGSG